VNHKAPEEAFLPFVDAFPPILPFRDALRTPPTFHLTIMDCLVGLQHGIRHRWFDYENFNVEASEHFENVDNGDMNWIIPDKFLAFAEPCSTKVDADGYPAFTPEDYVEMFKEARIKLVVRLNKKQYDNTRFIRNGIKHMDLYFVDGSCPSRQIIAKFLHVAESEPGAIAVHCKAGLGRTGTLIALYAMKHFQFPARAFIAWNRICRPGSILGQQQQFLVDMQSEMFAAGDACRRQSGDLADQFGRLQIRELQPSESREDVGQGERLREARRRTLPTNSRKFSLGNVFRRKTQTPC